MAKRIRHEQAAMFIDGKSIRVDKEMVPLLTLFNKLYCIRSEASCIDANGRSYIEFSSPKRGQIRHAALRLKAELNRRLITPVVFHQDFKEQLTYLMKFDIGSWPRCFEMSLRSDKQRATIQWPCEEYELVFNAIEVLVIAELTELRLNSATPIA